MINLLVIRVLLVPKEKIFLCLLISIGMIGAAFAFPRSFLLQSNLLIGLALIPFVVRIDSFRRFNAVFFLLSFFFELVAFIYGVRMFYFFALAFYSLWLAELFIGRVNILTIFLIAFMSPFFFQVSTILGFPIRLQLSQCAGSILQWMGMNVHVQGNLLLLDGDGFAVDEACMGLNMLALSLLMGVFIAAHHSRIHKKQLKLVHLTIFFAICFGLNMIANLFRIVVLVLFKIPAENPLHEIIGILCLIVYVLLPLYPIGRMMTTNLGKDQMTVFGKFNVNPATQILIVGFASLILYTGIHISQLKAKAIGQYALVQLSGFTTTYTEGGVTQLTNNELLIYLKPIPEFFTGEHTPLICWKGSGYTFNRITKTFIGNTEVYTAKLEKNGERLFTAWWYSNNKINTISQLEWRMRMLKGEEKFCLINITASDEHKLRQEISALIRDYKLKLSYHDIK